MKYTVYVGVDRQSWHYKGKLHREDGPAVVGESYQAWYFNGKLHRTDGPAVVDGDYQSWWINGKKHRTDGPAVVGEDYQAWWIDGEKLTEQEFPKRTNPAKELTVTDIEELLGYSVKIVKD